MTFDVTAIDMTVTTCVKCHVRMWNMWNHNTMLWKGFPGRKIHSAFPSCWLKILQKVKQWDQNYIFVQFKKGLEIQVFFNCETQGSKLYVLREICKSGDSPGKSNN